MKNVLIAAFVLGFALTGCHCSDTDRLVRVGRKVSENVQALAPEPGNLGGSIGLAKPASATERVRDRFRTDRYLTTQTIDVSVAESAVRLSGRVDSALLKRRAAEIAESTTGVDRVIDDIVVAE